MQPTRRAEELFHEAAALPPAERERFLVEQRAADPAVAREVESLLASLEAEIGFLERTASERRSRGPGPGSRLGQYEIVEEIASGGMGTVWRARRIDGAYEKQVAIKLIQHAALRARERDELERRFLEERQILAGLEHENIARLLDGGTAEDGSPYLVMELVEGVPIDEFCEAHALSLRERLELVARVCRAVQYAHAKFVAHRDIKPSNVLVQTGTRGMPEPKLLDFGIARLLQEREGMRRPSDPTIASPRLTPAYASPEQLRGERVGAATDVYSLGVLLYEVLTGRLPYDIAGRPPLEILAAICETSPTSPSRIDARLAGDIDTILLKALRKEPSERYASAQELADDIERHVRGHPILARRASALHRMRKFVLRHKLTSALVVAIAATLLGSSVWLDLLYLRARRSEALAEERRERADEARRSADERRRQAEETTTLFLEMFRSPDPFRAAGRETTVVEALDSGLPRVTERLHDEPAVLGRLRAVAGATYHGLGAYEAAERELRAGLELLESGGDLVADDLEATRYALAALLIDTGRLGEAGPLLEPLLERAGDPSFVPSEPELYGVRNLALYLWDQGDYPRSEELLAFVIVHDERFYGATHARTLEDRAVLADVMVSRRKFREAEAMLRAAIDAQVATLGEDHPATLEARSRLGDLMMRTARPAEAAALLEDCTRGLEATLGREHRVTLTTASNLATALSFAGDVELAEATYRDTLAMQREFLGERHRDTLKTASDFAGHLWKSGGVEEARELFDHVLELRRADFGIGHPETVITLLDATSLLAETGAIDAACRLLGECADALRSSAAERQDATRILRLHALRLIQAGRPDEARRELDPLVAMLEGHPAAWAPLELSETYQTLRILAESRQDAAAAERYRQLAAGIVER